MVDHVQLKKVIEKALANGREAGFGVTQQIEHGVRAVLQVYPEMAEKDAVDAVLNVRHHG
jgi:hypothetical protein